MTTAPRPPADAPRRVAVTGLGAVTPAGRDVAAFRDAVLAGEPLYRRGAFSFAAASVPDDSPREDMDPDAVRLLGRCARFAADAAIQAVLDARLAIRPETLPLIGVAMGSAFGEPESLLRWRNAADPEERDLWARRASLPPATAVARVIGAAGPCRSLAGGSAVGLAAVVEAAELIRRGDATFVVCGGADAPLAWLDAEPGAAERAGVSRTGAARPLASDADGIVPGEGAVAFVLEDLEIARQRGARVYAEALGWGETSSRSPVTDPRPNRVDAARALQAALMRGHTLQREVDALFASACGDPALDAVELEAIRTVWGHAAAALPVTAIAGACGHVFAASGPASMLAAILALGEGVLPPAAGAAPREEIDLVRERRHAEVRRAVVNAFDVSHHVSLVVAAPEDEGRT
ncbi:MAG TPA: beta-ketoacyl synthase N-terminal-like domain-containing protein [Dehalococcoidia bacterium]|nr:beta-ketoacyl synthase N-terminal-like domain-containing protein [Dehalococcoidia bacterium]